MKQNIGLDKTSISFIGCGVMGEAMLAGILGQRLIEPQRVIVCDLRADHREVLNKKYGVVVTGSNLEAAQTNEIVVLAVKPQILPNVLKELRGKLRPNQLVLSVVAGMTIDTIRRPLGTPSVVRVMPNTPARIGQGMTVWTATKETNDKQRAQARAILAALGKEKFFEDEKYLDMATAVSGSGPAYIFLVMEAMVDAAVHLGFSRQDALELVEQTMLGSVCFAIESGNHPAELRNQVTSPGGTTAEALYQFEKGGLRTVFSRAIWASYQRALQLGQSLKTDSLDE